MPWLPSQIRRSARLLAVGADTERTAGDRRLGGLRRRFGRALQVAMAAVLAALASGPWLLPRSVLARRVVQQPKTLGYEFHLIGNPNDVAPPVRAGMVLAGGGTDLDEGFRWLIGRSGGGDFLVLRTTGTDAYNPYIYDMAAERGLCADSVATLIIGSRDQAHDSFVLRAIREAEAIWIAGGDQSKHVRYWRGTPVLDEIQAAVARGVPVGGTSSGLSVMGEYVYTAEGDSPTAPHLTSTEAVRDPFSPRVTLRRDFLRLPHLVGTLLDPHFAQESRFGRMAAFLSRLETAGWGRGARGLGIERRTALLVEPDGRARVIAHPAHSQAGAYAFRMQELPQVCEPGRALQVDRIEAIRLRPGDTFDLRTWARPRGTIYELAAGAGSVRLTRKSP